jgi:hypothetical protein
MCVCVHVLEIPEINAHIILFYYHLLISHFIFRGIMPDFAKRVVQQKEERKRSVAAER